MYACMYFVVIISKTTDNIKKVSQTVMGCNKNKVFEKDTILKTELTYTLNVINNIYSLGIDCYQHRNILICDPGSQTTHWLFDLSVEECPT